MQPGSARESDRSFVERARREQIVAAAIEVLAESGYARASFARIAQRAGVSPALITYHFAVKDELLTQIVTDVTAAMDQAMTARAENATSYLHALRGMLEAFVYFCAEHRADMMALREVLGNAALAQTGAEGDTESGAAGGAERQGWDRDKSATELEQMLREGQAEGEFRDFTPRFMALTMLAAMEAVPHELYSKPGVDVARYADELATTFELAVRRPSRFRRTRG